MYPEIRVNGDDVSATLPKWVDELLFDEFHAINNPSGIAKEFDRNLDSDEEKILRYLGTYFPRSLLESYIIFNSLFAEKKYLCEIVKNNAISILSIGSGTGGDLLGLLLALKRNLAMNIPISVVSVEGNKKAHKKLGEVIEKANMTLNLSVTLSLSDYVITLPELFEGMEEAIDDRKTFDFVIASKMINELIGLYSDENLYYEFCQAFAPKLSEAGLLAIIDVASPVGMNRVWVPELLNRQTNAYILESDDFRIILPLICNSLGSTCVDGCYSQYRIKMNHRHCSNYGSKMCFRVIGYKQIADLLAKSPSVWKSPIARCNAEYCRELS